MSRLTLEIQGHLEGIVTINETVIRLPPGISSSVTLVQEVRLRGTNRIAGIFTGLPGATIRGFVDSAPETGQMIEARAGGCLGVEDEASPVNGLGLCFLPGSMDRDTLVTVHLEEEPFYPEDGGARFLGPAIRIEPAGLTLSSPALLTIPCVKCSQEQELQVRILEKRPEGTPAELADTGSSPYQHQVEIRALGTYQIVATVPPAP